MITQSAWNKYIRKLAAIDTKAADLMQAWIDKNGLDDEDGLIQYAYALATKYGEASATLSSEMYDYMASMMNAGVPAAVPAETASMREVAKGTMWGKYHSPSQIPSVISRQVRQAGADTMIQNARRDGAEWAWIPQGDTCAFCITLASRGWQPASKAVLKGNHAEHIHQNCDCTFAIAFKPSDKNQYDYVYDPEKYRDMYYGAEGETPSEKINAIRRKIDQQKKDTSLGALKRIDDFEKKNMSSTTESGLLVKKDGTTREWGGIEHSVQGQKSDLADFDGGIFTHNHPTDVTFSSNDIVNGIVNGNLAELRAITKEGNLHQLFNHNATLQERRAFLTQFNEKYKKFTNLAIQKERRGEHINRLEFVNERMERWLSENASNYNLEYRKTVLR